MLEPQKGSFPKKSFFWASSSNFIFSSLPDCVAADATKFKGLRTLFSGEFDTVIFESTEAPKVIDAVHGIVLQPKHLTELDRLSFVVHEIDNSCAAIPSGALKYTPLHQVIFNEAFKGVAASEAFDLCGWRHFRRPENQE